jgi:hypothetical protein
MFEISANSVVVVVVFPLLLTSHIRSTITLSLMFNSTESSIEN